MWTYASVFPCMSAGFRFKPWSKQELTWNCLYRSFEPDHCQSTWNMLLHSSTGLLQVISVSPRWRTCLGGNQCVVAMRHHWSYFHSFCSGNLENKIFCNIIVLLYACKSWDSPYTQIIVMLQCFQTHTNFNKNVSFYAFAFGQIPYLWFLKC